LLHVSLDAHLLSGLFKRRMSACYCCFFFSLRLFSLIFYPTGGMPERLEVFRVGFFEVF
jgi:hypothetical protein